MLQALTTVVPYYPEDGPPTSEQLQIYIKSQYIINLIVLQCNGVESGREEAREREGGGGGGMGGGRH